MHLPEFDPLNCRCPQTPYSERIFAQAQDHFSRRAFLTGALAAGVAVVLPWRTRAASGTTLIKAAHLFDGHQLHTPGVIVISDDRIVSMNGGDAGSDAQLIELRHDDYPRCGRWSRYRSRLAQRDQQRSADWTANSCRKHVAIDNRRAR